MCYLLFYTPHLTPCSEIIQFLLSSSLGWSRKLARRDKHKSGSGRLKGGRVIPGLSECSWATWGYLRVSADSHSAHGPCHLK